MKKRQITLINRIGRFINLDLFNSVVLKSDGDITLSGQYTYESASTLQKYFDLRITTSTGVICAHRYNIWVFLHPSN